MNRLWLGLCILAVLLGLGGVTTYGMDRICTPIADKLSSAAELVQNEQWEQASALSYQARQRWEQWHDLTASVTDHDPMEEVDALFAALEIFAKEKDTLRFAECCARLSALSQAIGEAQSAYWWSIL